MKNWNGPDLRVILTAGAVALLLGIGVGWVIATRNVSDPTQAAAVAPRSSHDLVGIGDVMPDFEMTTIDRKPVRFSELAGRSVVLNFWATWCRPCRAEMPILQEFYELNKDSGVEVVGIDAGESIDLVRAFLQQQEIEYPVWIDPPDTLPPGNASMDLFRRLGGVGLPHTVFVDSAGVVRGVHVGEIDRETLDRSASALILR